MKGAVVSESGASGAVSARIADRDLALDDLAYLNRMTTVGHVLPTVAHELNNALQIISGLVEFLAAKENLPTGVGDKVRRIGAQAERATGLVRDLVAFSRRDDAGVALVDVGKVVEGALAFRHYQLARASIAVSVQGAEPGGVLARLDRGHLHQILLNLIINAEHGLAGQVGAQLTVRCQPTPVGIEISVGDNGGGIPSGLLDRLVDPFFTTRAQAAGLGLTVATGLASELGGHLRLRSSAAGTVAVLTLPTHRP